MMSLGPKKALRGRAFTLMEMILASAVMAVLLVSVTGAIMLTTHGLPQSQTSAAHTIDASDALDRLSADLFSATSFLRRSGAGVEFVVTDRDRDSNPETIAFDWGGKGAPLNYTLNGKSSPLAASLSDFEILYQTRSVSRTDRVTNEQNFETLQSSFSGWSGILAAAQNFVLTDKAWICEYFPVNFPNGAIDPRISRVQVMMKTGSAPSGTPFYVWICSANAAGKPVSPIGSPVTRYTNSLSSSYTWQEFAFNDVSLNAGTTGVCIVIAGSTASTAQVNYSFALLAPVDATIMYTTSNSGTDWGPALNLQRQDMPFSAWATYRVSNSTDVTTTREFVTGVTLKARATDDAPRLETTIALPNAPEVTP